MASKFSGRSRIIIPATVVAVIAAVVVVVILVVSGEPETAPATLPRATEAPPPTLAEAIPATQTLDTLGRDVPVAEGQFPWTADGLNDLEQSTVQFLDEIRRDSPDTVETLLRWYWLTDELTVGESLVIPPIQAIAKEDDSLAQRLVGLPWLADSVSEEELQIIVQLRDIAERDSPLATLLVDTYWFADGASEVAQLTLSVVLDAGTDEDPSLVGRIVDTGVLSDGITSAELAIITGTPNYYLDRLEREYPATAEIVGAYPWASGGTSHRLAPTSSNSGLLAFPLMSNGTTELETYAIRIIWSIANHDEALSQRVATYPWVADGITEEEILLLRRIDGLGRNNPSLALDFVVLPWVVDGFTKPEANSLLTLLQLVGHQQYLAESLISQSWFQDDITGKEGALVVTLNSACRSISSCRDLIDNGQISEDILSLPTGNVSLFIVSPFELDDRGIEQVLQGMRTGIENIEEIMRIPWPAENTIVYLEPGFSSQAISPGFWAGTHFVIGGISTQPYFSKFTMYHELAHYYLHSGHPIWLIEGGANFLARYVQHKSENRSMEAFYNVSRQSVDDCISRFRSSNLHQVAVTNANSKDLCDYYWGERLLLGLYTGLGQDVVSASLHDLHLKSLQYAYSLGEELPYLTFLSNTPADMRDALERIYHDLHGRPVGYINPDRLVLEALYHATNGDGWVNNQNWLREDVALIDWHGVGVQTLNDRVVELDLRNNDLTGELPEELEELDHLTHLYIFGNQLTGCIPDQLYGIVGWPSLPFCRDLAFQRLTQTRVPSPTPAPTQPLPEPTPATPGTPDAHRAALAAFYHATGGPNWANSDKWLSDAPIGQWYGVTTDSGGRVTRLQLADNQLIGTMPIELSDLTALTALDLSRNQIAGPLPPWLGELSNLLVLSLADNQFVGPLPGELAQLKRLQHLFLSRNNLTIGPLPSWLADLTNLRYLDLSQSRVTGSIPATLGDLAKLESLDLASNHVGGPIPPKLGNLSQLDWLRLEGNALSGPIPPSLGNLPLLRGLHLGGNQLTGTIPSELGKLSKLEYLRLSNNQLSGSIPEVLTNLSSLLQISLAGNRFTGCVPSGLRGVESNDFSTLNLPFCEAATGPAPRSSDEDREVLVAVYNSTDGARWTNRLNWLSDEPLSEWYGVATNVDGAVVELDLERNGLSGRVPPELGNLVSLETLKLGYNNFVGELPPDLGRLVNLRSLGLTNASGEGGLTGEIPPELGRLTNLQVLALGGHALRGELPSELRNLTNLRQLVLWRNEFSGPIPQWLDAFPELTRLELWSNNFSGPVPTEMGHLRLLTRLQLADNQLSGEIPPALGSLTNLEFVTMSENQLTGCVPSSWRYIRENDFGALGLPPCDLEPEPAEPPAPEPTYVVLQDEREALVAFFRNSGGYIWTNSNNWLTDAPLHLWHGIGTDHNGHVTQIRLNQNNLTGHIAFVTAELANLPELRLLDLSSNKLEGEIPSDLGKLSTLTELGLGGNQLSGPIPPEVSHLANLESLALLDNRLTGVLPVELGLLLNLKYLELTGNQLSGPIPAELGRLSNLRSLGLGWNDFSGPIPPELGSLTNLSWLVLGFAGLSGEIPQSLGNLTELSDISLTGNNFSGCLPSHWSGVEHNDFHNVPLPFCGE